MTVPQLEKAAYFGVYKKRGWEKKGLEGLQKSFTFSREVQLLASLLIRSN
jgi:hypothetical protein